MSITTETSTEKKTWAVDPVHSSVEFAVKHMMVTTVRGRFEKFDVVVNFDEANLETSSVEAKIQAASIDTRAADRDGHLNNAPELLPAFELGGVVLPHLADERQFSWLCDSGSLLRVR